MLICFVFVWKIGKMLCNRGNLWPLLRKISTENNPRGSPGLKEKHRKGKDCQNKNPGVSKVEMSRGTPGLGVFKETLAIPMADHGLKIPVCT